MWEVFLEEASKGIIPLSRTGSGLKTVILVLVNLLLLPEMDNTPLAKLILGFEKLENNLHPAVQRRLFRYLHRRAIEDKCLFFITTHSGVVIDLFSRDADVQIVHVTHDGCSSQVRTVDSHALRGNVLDDLDVRASDLLQTNVVVWVEGPSDVIYFNAWMSKWSDGALVEGIHYQCVPYGGSVSAHLTFERDEEVQDMIAAIRVNRHAIVLIDSDKDAATSSLKKHAERLKEEIERAEGYTWITAGREVENYIPESVLASLEEGLSPPSDSYFRIPALVAKHRGVEEIRKVDLANAVCPSLTKANLAATLDLAERLDEVCEQIRRWNRLDTSVGR